MTVLGLEQIRTDGDTQSRVAMDAAVIREYAEAIEAGNTLPPVVVFFDGTSYWLADGFHRLAAYQELHKRNIEAVVLEGTQRDAILHSVGANATHGLRRTNEDKRQAVMTLLKDAEWTLWSDREIARRCGVSPTFVGKMRLTVHDGQSDVRYGRDGRAINTKNIGDRHWSQTGRHAETFWDRVRAYGLQDFDLGKLQRGAKELADLTLKRDEAFHALRRMAIEYRSEQWKSGDYVKHQSGRYGKVLGVLPEYLDVLDLKIQTQQGWAYDGCEKITRAEWEEQSRRIVEFQTKFTFGQTCHTIADCVIYQIEEDDTLSVTAHTMKANTTVLFVRAFRADNYSFAEVKWGGGPVRIPLPALKAGPAPEPETRKKAPASSETSASKMPETPKDALPHWQFGLKAGQSCHLRPNAVLWSWDGRHMFHLAARRPDRHMRVVFLGAYKIEGHGQFARIQFAEGPDEGEVRYVTFRDAQGLPHLTPGDELHLCLKMKDDGAVVVDCFGYETGSGNDMAEAMLDFVTVNRDSWNALHKQEEIVYG